MELTSRDQKVMRKVVRYFQSLEEMAAYLGIHVDELAGRIKSQNIKLTLEKRSTFDDSRSQVFKDAEAKHASPLFNYTVS